MIVSDVTLSGSDRGLDGGAVTAERLTITQCTTGALLTTLTGSDITISDNTVGIAANTINAVRLTATQNGGQGLLAPHIVLTDSTVTQNGLDADGSDIASRKRPTLQGSITCNRSVRIGGIPPSWCICSEDIARGCQGGQFRDSRSAGSELSSFPPMPRIKSAISVLPSRDTPSFLLRSLL